MCVAKTKALISFAAKLIWVFVFAYADCWFSHAVVQLFEKSSLMFVVTQYVLISSPEPKAHW